MVAPLNIDEDQHTKIACQELLKDPPRKIDRESLRTIVKSDVSAEEQKCVMAALQDAVICPSV